MAPRCVGSALLTVIGSMALAATSPAAVAPEIAYIYDTDTAARDAFGIMLWSAGFDVATVALGDVETHDFSVYDLILVGRDTGVAYVWGTPQAVANVVTSNLPVIGLGMGGAAFFHELGLDISYGHCMGASGSGVVVEDQGHALWNRPDPISIPPDGSVTLYVGPSHGQILYLGTAPAEVTCFGRVIEYPGYCGIASERWQGPFVALWSLHDLPNEMTGNGRDAFTNLVWYGVDTLLPIFADGFEDGTTGEWSATTP